MALQGASGASIRIPREDMADWIAALRSQMPHGPTWPATTPGAQATALRSPLVRGAFLPFGKLRPSTGLVKVTHSTAVKLLAQGRWLAVAIDYDRLNDLMPELSGSPTFRKGHMIALGGHARQSSVAWTHLGDPLHDGRRAGIPKGWQSVRVRRYLRAAETWGNAGHGKAWVIWLSQAEDMK